MIVTLEVQNGAFDSLSAVELSNFAMNQNYKENHPDVKKKVELISLKDLFCL